MISLASLPAQYLRLKGLAAENVAHPDVAALLLEMTDRSLLLLSSECEEVTLTCSVPGKEYVAYRLGSRMSRPVNRRLFITDREEIRRRAVEFEPGGLAAMSVDDATSTIYTVAMAFCAATDVLRTGDKKTPATYFEILNGYLFSATFGVLPRTRIEVLNLDQVRATLPTDFIFDLGADRPKFHLPIKISTRERVIQVWAHQRVLDGVYGAGRFTGILVVLNETKLDLRTHRVIEICLPDQWKLYQQFIARIERMYYLDPPNVYSELAGFPKITVKKLGEFFREKDALMAGHV